jgi:O-antigen/teichoic acid export membrane protein
MADGGVAAGRPQVTAATQASDLRTSVLHGLAWSMLTVATCQVSRLLFGIMLARLLTPEEYGLAGLALVFSSLVIMLSDVALGAALVQRPTITEADRSTVFWTSAFIGVVFAIVGVASSGAIASLYGEPAVQPLFAVLSVTFLIMSLGRAHAALFHREMDFRAIAIRGIGATFLGGSIGVTAAMMGYGAWALIAQHIGFATATTVFLWAFSPWRPRMMFSVDSLRNLGGFGLNVSGARVVEYLNMSADKLLIGKFLGSSALGIYSVAYNVVLMPLSGLLIAIRDTMFPALSRVQEEPARLANGWLRATRLLAAISIPAMLSLAVVAHDFVVVVLGDRWEGAVPVLQIIALAGIVQAVSSVHPVVLTAADRTQLLLRFSLLELAVVIPAMAIGLRWGIVGVAAAYAVATTATRLVLSWLTARTLERSVGDVLRSLVDVVQASVITAAVVALARYALLETEVPSWLRLVTLVVLGSAVYLVVATWRTPDLIAEVMSLIRRRHGRAAW